MTAAVKWQKKCPQPYDSARSRNQHEAAYKLDSCESGCTVRSSHQGYDKPAKVKRPTKLLHYKSKLPQTNFKSQKGDPTLQCVHVAESASTDSRGTPAFRSCKKLLHVPHNQTELIFDSLVEFRVNIVHGWELRAGRCRVSLPEPVPLEDLIDLFHMQTLALRQQEVDEKGADSAAASEEQEHTADHRTKLSLCCHETL